MSTSTSDHCQIRYILLFCVILGLLYYTLHRNYLEASLDAELFLLEDMMICHSV